jgi:D-alanine-D-alanine ligase
MLPNILAAFWQNCDPQAPISLTPVEVLFGKGETFKHFDLKWRDYETLSWRPVDAKVWQRQTG